MRDVQIYLKEVVASVDSDADWREFPLSLPFMRNLRIEFKTPVTLPINAGYF